MKTLLAALAATAALSFASSAYALPPSCTTTSKSAEVPSGTYVDSNGRKWVGFKQDGTPPDSLATDSDSTSCPLIT